jgi:hypothetical protein
LFPRRALVSAGSARCTPAPIACFWSGPALLIVDELGYLPMPGEAAAHLFQVISRRYEHGSIILTTNRGIASWGEIFEDTTVAAAILDRLLHHATVLQIDGQSYRMCGHRETLSRLRAPQRLRSWQRMKVSPGSPRAPHPPVGQRPWPQSGARVAVSR